MNKLAIAVVFAVFVPTHSGGSAPELRRLPFSAPNGATETPLPMDEIY